MENRIRMQIFMFFYFLGINIFQATGDDNSTQMLFFNLTIDQSIYNNITMWLRPIVNNDWIVDNLTMTTVCQSVSSGTMCSCNPGYRWSDQVCQTQKCCSSNCTFSNNPVHMCIANTTVIITGSISLNPQVYQNCLAVKTSNAYIQCNENLTTQMQNVYSNLKGFDVLSITQYSVGSIIAAFQIIIVFNVNPQDLFATSEKLAKDLNATLILQTSGVVSITMPKNPVCYNSQGQVKCTSNSDLGTNPTWQLQQDVAQTITNGTQAQLTSVPMQTTVSLSNITELWEGTYTCAYINMTSTVTITHQASATMDVSLLPQILIYTVPQYPLCHTNQDLLNVRVYCQISQSNESYSVSWSAQNITAAVIPDKYSTGQTVYSATTVVNCNSPNTPQTVTCTFTNRCNQTKSSTNSIIIIPAGEPYCATDGVWQNTRAGYQAVIQCTSASGQMRRTCLSTAKWDAAYSECVYQVLYNVLQKAIIVDIGLGTLNGNAATVFSQFQAATNNSQLINSFANIEASVNVLTNLSSKLYQISNTSTVDDLLTSSSNLLNKSLQYSWKNTTDNNNNSNLAESYLESVEQLIHIANFSSSTKPNVAVAMCNTTNCHNDVFNVSVTLSGADNDIVKTTGFQQLQNYLPTNESDLSNSIVVSTTTASNPSSVEITINFQLLYPRPRNTLIKCVAWDKNSSTWLTDGCTWQGANNPGTCKCNHLSSFAALMSRQPIDLPGETEITYAGLSVSIMSLLISLMIEMTVWSAVVKTNTLYLRHTAHVNISLCLLIADCCFLASSTNYIPQIWCQTFVVLKHFCYLSMFFWMLCLSSTLLHQAIFLFHNVSKKNYLRFSLVLGYVCPFLIVFITFLTNNAGAEGQYYSLDDCWLVYAGPLKGSIFTFVIPVGIIIFINVFSMLVVIMKLLDHPKNTDKSHEKQKNAAKSIVRTVIFLTPIFGLTWSLGFAVMIIDLTSGIVAFAVNYAFTLLNSFQGFFILLTTCLGDKVVRDTLLSRIRKTASASISESTTKLDSSWKK